MPDSSPHLDQLQLLKHANMLSREFAPEERADILADLAAAAVSVQPSQAKAWANQLLHISQELPRGQFRASVQKKALCVIAMLDADRAASLWKLQGTPETWTKGRLVAEDIRSAGTSVLFPALWDAKQIESVPTIQAIANWLGLTGQYPYASVAEIIRKLAASDREGAEALYVAGISHLRSGQRYETTNRQFVEFILKTKQLVNPHFLREALQVAVQSIESANHDRSGASSEVTTVASMADRAESERLLVELLPTIRDVDLHLAHRLIDKYSSVRRTSDLATSDLTPISSSDGSQAAPIQEPTDEDLLRRVQALAANDRKLATQIAATIRDRDLQSVALVNLASGCADTNEGEFASWISLVNCCLEDMSPEVPKLKLMVALCSGYFGRKRFSEVIAMMHASFELGEPLFGRYMRINSGALAHSAPSFVLLSQLVEMAVRYLPSPCVVTNAVELFSNKTLAVRMLVVAAAALGNRQDYQVKE